MNAVATGYLELVALMRDDDRFIRENVSWDEYEELLAELDGVRKVRVSYDRGRLELMALSLKHERTARFFGYLILVLTEELNLEFMSCGSTTLKREQAEAGQEPDDCFYIGALERIHGKQQLDLEQDPPPDLAIEVDITHPTLSKFPIYAGLGVPELWRYEEGQVEFYRLEEYGYVSTPASNLFPFLPPEIVAEMIERGANESINAMLRAFRQWVQAHKPH